MLKTRELPVPAGTRRRSGRKLLKKGGVTIHNVGNRDKGANADANARYQKNSANEAVNGWHWTVDEKEAVQSFPNGEIAEHSGKRLGNDTTVGIEICDNADGDIKQATDNGAELAAMILKEQGYAKAVWKENIFQHHDWSGKDCPQEIRAGQPYNWETFVAKVNECMGAEPERMEPKPAGGPTFVFGRVLKRGEEGKDVETLQGNLNSLGMRDARGQELQVDGNFGNRTEEAVKRFQSRQRLKIDGKFGEKSTAAMGGKWEGGK